MSAPPQKRGKSRQDYETPNEFVDAVVDRFGRIEADLAATSATSKSCSGVYVDAAEDSLSVDWLGRFGRGPLLWLNPPFARIDPWAAKCAAAGAQGVRVALLVPASIGTEWFAAHVHGRALVLGIRPRLTFVGETQPYPKDLMLCVFGRWSAPGFDVWRWK